MDRSDFTERGLLTEFAKVFDEEHSAKAILEQIGFPRQRLPSFGNGSAEQFWQSVTRELDRGVVADAFEALVRAAADRYPGNMVFNSIVESPPAREAVVGGLIDERPDEEGLQTPAQAWDEWSHRTREPVSEELVTVGRKEQEKELIDRLVAPPSTFTVRGDSPQEAWGFTRQSHWETAHRIPNLWIQEVYGQLA